ncbi:hypothetical protein D3OALGA1CA_4542 [Olavius algarvensis associated proteobacterium Delta 3]|nr:hypothetical protein D3OALGB2SA_1579 [Olavius algarvensis associated proteobacterium Delta 3]CAB5153047.1 hypothetical protein D3OALGA1CA_4542 [Olavius algarvensis associated proteobacterium Delta 3]
MTEEEKGFVIKDRRIFSEEGSEDTAEPRPEPATETASPEEPPEAREEESYSLPEINFATFIFSLNSSALVHLGIIEDPAANQMTKNLSLAKQTIDILGILEEKTKGNLTGDEEKLLTNILHDLRLMYVKACS